MSLSLEYRVYCCFWDVHVLQFYIFDYPCIMVLYSVLLSVISYFSLVFFHLTHIYVCLVYFLPLVLCSCLTVLYAHSVCLVLRWDLCLSCLQSNVYVPVICDFSPLTVDGRLFFPLDSNCVPPILSPCLFIVSVYQVHMTSSWSHCLLFAVLFQLSLTASALYLVLLPLSLLIVLYVVAVSLCCLSCSP